eukprot:6191088-Prymnesium_polylepis.2
METSGASAPWPPPSASGAATLNHRASNPPAPEAACAAVSAEGSQTSSGLGFSFVAVWRNPAVTMSCSAAAYEYLPNQGAFPSSRR